MTAGPVITIDPDDAETLFGISDGQAHNGWTRVTDQTISTGRWREHCWLVVSRGEDCYGIPYELGLTEMQDHSMPWQEYPKKPIELIPLVGVPVTTTKYLTEKQYAKHLATSAVRGA